MGHLSVMEKKDRAERVANQANNVLEVKSMLAEFTKDRLQQAQEARDERKTFLLKIKSEVANLRQVKTPVKVEPRLLNVKAAPSPVAVPQIKVVESPVVPKVAEREKDRANRSPVKSAKAKQTKPPVKSAKAKQTKSPVKSTKAKQNKKKR